MVMMNKFILTETADKQMKDIDEVIDARAKNQGNEISISEGLVAKYDVKIFDGENSKVGADVNSAQLFYENAILDDEVSQAETTDIFGSETKYNQSNITEGASSYMLIAMWIVMWIVICVLVIKILEKRKQRAKKNRNQVQVQSLYS